MNRRSTTRQFIVLFSPHTSKFPSSTRCLTTGNNPTRRPLTTTLKAPTSTPNLTTTPSTHALSRLPLSSIVRSLVLGTFFTSPLLVRPGLAILQKIADSRSALLSPDGNPLIRAVVKPLIYDHFCAGTNRAGIRRSVERLKGIGYSGVILCYGKEFDPRDVGKSEGVKEGRVDPELEHWRKGNLETLEMLGEGDVLGIKITGAGKMIAEALRAGESPPPQFTSAMQQICTVAEQNNHRIFIDAEQNEFQASIDAWTIDLMRRHNRNNNVLVYTTIQSYLKHARSKLHDQLQLADKEGWTLAFKLVRGAYIAYDPRSIIHDTKEQTDECYDGIVRDLLTGSFESFTPDTMPNIRLFLAGHNPESVAKASALVSKLSATNSLKTVPEFGQLHGMADTLGCRLMQQVEEMQASAKNSHAEVPLSALGVYKWSTWGSLRDCMQYLVRRAVENQGATERMKDGLDELSGELKRRVGDWAMGRRRSE